MHGYKHMWTVNAAPVKLGSSQVFYFHFCRMQAKQRLTLRIPTIKQECTQVFHKWGDSNPGGEDLYSIYPSEMYLNLTQYEH